MYAPDVCDTGESRTVSKHVVQCLHAQGTHYFDRSIAMGRLRKAIGIGTAAVTITAAPLLTFAAGTVEHAHDSKGAARGSSMEMHQSMMSGMKQMQGMKMSGNMDHDFATMMRLHHEHGIKMAQMELQHGKDPKMREMAQKIIDSKKKEMAEFDDWLKANRSSAKK
jgi:hypothetical protein